MKNQKGFTSLVIIFVLTAASIIAIAGIYIYKSNQSTNTPKQTQSGINSSSNIKTDYATIQGKVTSIDLTAMQVDGDGIYEIKSDDNKTYFVHLTSGESNCAIYQQNGNEAVIGNINKSSNVEVRGKNDNNILRICDEGTYIKTL